MNTFWNSSARRAWAVLAMLAALSGCGDSPVVAPGEGAPQSFTFNLSSYPTGTTLVRMDGGAVIVEFFSGGTSRTLRTVPTAAEWAAFWRAADDAGVRQWNPEYRAEHIVDGLGWSLALTGHGLSVQSQGANAYPDRAGREQEGTPTPEFVAFVNALGTLTGWQFFGR